MNIQTIHDMLCSYLNQEHQFLYFGLRGQNETFTGKVICIYPRTFLIQTNSGQVKSFSYSDFALKLLKIL